jgi:DNA-binding XRE family transcriptional regulator
LIAKARKVRSAHLFQADLAKIFGVDEASIRNWEKNTYQPTERLMSGIGEWLGYDPRSGHAE